VIPESFNRGHKCSKEDDIFSLGCIIYFIITGGKHPFNFEPRAIILNEKDLSALEKCQDRNKNRFYIHLIMNMSKKKKLGGQQSIKF
jgi:serine/threonine protein kinase